MAEWKKVIVSGSQAELAGVTGSFTGSFIGDGSQLTGIATGGSGAFISSGSFSASFSGSNASPIDRLIITSGSQTLLTVSSSGKVFASGGFNVGQVTGSGFLSNFSNIAAPAAVSSFTPTDVRSWQDGDATWDSSIFASAINENTQISEVLYFLLRGFAGSYQEASPNPRVFSNITTPGSITPTAVTAPFTSYRVPQGTTGVSNIDDLRTYWHDNGGFFLGYLPGGTYYGDTLFTGNSGYTVSSTVTGTGNGTVTRFGIGGLNPASNFNPGNPPHLFVSASITYRSVTTNAGAGVLSQTYTSSSLHQLSQTTVGSSNGLTVGKVAASTTQKFAEAEFATVSFGNNIRYKHSNNQGASGLSAPAGAVVAVMGYYHVSASVGVASASFDGSNLSLTRFATDEFKQRFFYLPTSLSSLSSATVFPDAVSKGTPTLEIVPAADAITSCSLSGAPYITSVAMHYSESVSNAFKYLYADGNIWSLTTNPSTAGGNASVAPTLTNSPSAIAINNGQVNTANRVFDSTGNTVRSTGTVPTFNDILKTSYRFTWNSSAEPNESGIITAANDANPTMPTINAGWPSVTRNTTTQLSTAITRTLIQAGDVPAGAITNYMTWRKRGQGAAARSANASQEKFLCETYRLQIGSSVLTFDTASAAWPTTFNITNALSAIDLQQKPGTAGGFLVKPGGTRGYYINTPAGAGDFMYYMTWFDMTSGTNPTFYETLSVSLSGGSGAVAWNDTTSNNRYAALVLMQACRANSGLPNADLYGTEANFIDPFDLTGFNNGVYSVTANGIISANTSGLNPFSSNIRVQSNYDPGLGNAIILDTGNRGRYLSKLSSNPNLGGSNTKVAVLIRYKGDPDPLTQIQVTAS